MDGKILIYAAGDPNNYPLEYFDEETQNYQGIVPRLLKQFSEESRYEIVYFDPGETDRRKDYADEHQVDLISGEIPSSSGPYGSASLFLSEYQGESAYYPFSFTKATPDDFKEEFQTFLSDISSQEITGMLLTDIKQPQNPKGLYIGIFSLAIAVILLAIGLITLLIRYRKRLKQTAAKSQIDPLTGLGNLEYLKRRYTQQVQDKNRILYHIFFFYTDVDHLRRIGGNQEAERFLQHCTAVLKEYTAETDLLSYAPGQGFVLIKMVTDQNGVDPFVHTIVQQMENYAHKYEKAFDTPVYVGIYSMKKDDFYLEDMIFYAAECAYQAQRREEKFLICSPQIIHRLNEEKQLQADIEEAFETHAFELYLQFYVDTVSHDIVGGEALSRWNHPQKGLLMPSSFVPLMEREKRISQLDYYCLNEVCVFLQGLFDAGVDRFFISCNFSRETFAAADFLDRVKEIVKAYTFPKELLIFEITESVSPKNSSRIQQNILQLRKNGIKVVLDDFGEGFTSFYDLQKYSINGLKLDHGLIDQITTPNGLPILKAMIQVGHELNMTILAEGVEQKEQVEALQKIRCDAIQGFYFYHPLPCWDAKQKILNQWNLHQKK